MDAFFADIGIGIAPRRDANHVYRPDFTAIAAKKARTEICEFEEEQAEIQREASTEATTEDEET